MRSALSPTIASRHSPFRRFALSCLAASLCAASLLPTVSAQEVRFAQSIAPILANDCLICHGGDRTDGQYSVATLASLFASGDSQKTPITPNAPDTSELLARIVSDDPALRMPQDGPKLSDEKIATLRRWIEQGARVEAPPETELISLIESKKQPWLENYPRPVPASALAIAPDGEFIFVAGYYEVTQWKTSDGSLTGRIPVHGRFVSDIELSKDQQSIYVASGDVGSIGFVDQFPLAANAQVPSTDDQHQPARINRFVTARDVPLDIALSPSGEQIAIGLHDGSLIVCHSQNPSQRFTIMPHAAAITSVCWSPNGETLFTSSRDRMAKSYQAKDGQVLTSFSDHERAIGSINTVPAGTITYDETGKIRLFPNGGNNSRSQREQLLQRVQKIISSNKLVLIPDLKGIRVFNAWREDFNNEGITEEKDKKKPIFHLDDHKRLECDQSQPPIALAVTTNDNPIAVAGFANGAIVVWRLNESNLPAIQFVAKP